MNAWFSHLRADGVIASGNAGIWVTPLSGEPVPVSPVGTMPVWAGQTLVYNRNDGTTQIGIEGEGRLSTRVPAAYNEYVGCDGGQWAGVVQAGLGRVDRNDHAALVQTYPEACKPQFYGLAFGYLAPYQSAQRSLIIDGTPRANGVISEWAANRDGNGYVYAVFTGKYEKHIFDNKGNDVTIRTQQQDETPLVCFTGPDGYPWMLSQTTNSGTFVRMIYSAFGYVIPGILDVPDARVIGSQLRVVGSDKGVPRNLWIDFAAPKQDLRLV